jgi:uncharacterized LabA/DUF88 family protein
VGFLIKNTMQKHKISVYIDGSNLYHKLKSLDIPNTISFNYKGLCEYLARGRDIISLRYYTGAVRAKAGDNKSQQLRREQQKLFSHLYSQGFEISRGYIMKSNKTYHEKGVDVKIAIDILIGAYDKLYDTAILLSSDTDLIPAIKKVKELGKNIEYIGFAHQPSFGLQKHATRSFLLPKEDLEQFVVKKLL